MGKYNFSEDEQYLLQQNLVEANNLEELEIAEQYVFTVRALQFEQGYFNLNKFNLISLMSLHNHLFQDVYGFAGEIRDVQLIKGNTRFCQMQYISSELNSTFNKLASEQTWLTIDEAANRLAYYKSELNIIHPFREGNGRTIRMFIYALAQSKGYEWNYNELDKEQYMNSMIQSVFNTTLLERMFNETLKTI